MLSSGGRRRPPAAGMCDVRLAEAGGRRLLAASCRRVLFVSQFSSAKHVRLIDLFA
jgi:hypothetical protein